MKVLYIGSPTPSASKCRRASTEIWTRYSPESTRECESYLYIATARYRYIKVLYIGSHTIYRQTINVLYIGSPTPSGSRCHRASTEIWTRYSPESMRECARAIYI